MNGKILSLVVVRVVCSCYGETDLVHSVSQLIDLV